MSLGWRKARDDPSYCTLLEFIVAKLQAHGESRPDSGMAFWIFNLRYFRLISLLDMLILHSYSKLPEDMFFTRRSLKIIRHVRPRIRPKGYRIISQWPAIIFIWCVIPWLTCPGSTLSLSTSRGGRGISRKPVFFRCSARKIVRRGNGFKSHRIK
jgi:hypothetical protein